ncbi:MULTISPECIES: NAD(P)-dependent oxidoreductase [unclassified Streptomyces]|uniref:NAD(P)-dependent oxidoreductase n=1 Tax=unclassified Streptomyces TaxID=2593676 RepID=UPI00081DDA4C|nr:MULTISPECIES: NAD(P)-dependent oxidoreductase [unclassified Streptomyces]MYR92459.1 hydroxyacid dehydrogenase [Streptomyces sp. SID4937]SCD34195.1 D-3-phosphoglycerate dehydrogenase/(S)-sulfolactate dehydrogenase [Streptomyces sp. ScaeMP-e83]
MARVLITTDYLRPGDEADQYLTARGHTTVHTPLAGVRDIRRLAAAYADAEAALVGHEPLSAEVLSRAPRLRAVVRTGVGYDSVDTDAAARLGITVSNLPGINANAVAEYTLGLLLAAARRLVQSATGVAAGGWPRQEGRELRGSTLGLLGYGAAARAVVPLAQAFGMRVVCTTGVPRAERTDPTVSFVELSELLPSADYLSVHTALTVRTRGLLDAAAFGRMKPTAVLINTARGAVVDERALAEAVRTGQIAGAALDVVGEEPLPADSPLRNVENISVYSHLAGQTAEAREASGREGAAELVASLAGRPRFAVNTAHSHGTSPEGQEG